MTRFRPSYLSLAIILCVGAASPGMTAQDGAAAPETPAAAAAAQGEVDPESVAALKRMSAYLMSLNTAEITSEGSLDVVTAEGQRVQLDGVTNYKIRKPGFVIDYNSDLKSRRFIYDGKNFTVVSPKLGFYATVPAPATNREVLDLAYQTYGIRLPLEDLFRWNDPNSVRIDDLKSGYKLGTATLGGVATDHYVFREEAIDWEVWIQQGDQPVPRKMVIIDRTDPAHPTFIARLNWKVNPPLTDADFAFAPTKDQKRIDLATFEGSGE
jgi:hypothetical protein